jgi:cytochrome oxidase Cu insertion factor (SCO1/SenC/PrrC family)
MMPAVKVLRIVVLALLATITACAGRTSTGPRAAGPPTPSAEAAREASSSNLPKAHDFTVDTFQGNTFTLSDHFGKVPVVLNFWAPW